MKKKFFVFTLAVMMLFAFVFIGAGCTKDPEALIFETVEELVEYADGKPILIFLSKTN